MFVVEGHMCKTIPRCVVVAVVVCSGLHEGGGKPLENFPTFYISSSLVFFFHASLDSLLLSLERGESGRFSLLFQTVWQFTSHIRHLVYYNTVTLSSFYKKKDTQKKPIEWFVQQTNCPRFIFGQPYFHTALKHCVAGT